MVENDSGPQTVILVDKSGRKKWGKLTKLIKFRASPKEVYLLNQVDKELGYGNVSTTLRHLLASWPDVKRGKRLVELAAQIGAAEAEFEAVAKRVE